MRLFRSARPARSVAPQLRPLAHQRRGPRRAVISVVAMSMLGIPLAVASPAQAAPIWMDATQTPTQRANEVIAAMTLDDKISMLHNAAGCAYAGCTPTTFSGGTLPALHLQDGPLGVGDGVTGVTQLPAPVAAAATWDTSLMQSGYGTVLGQEHWGKGVNVVLGPTVNIVRDPRWGRAFESFGEDPYLTGQIAAAEINGIQAQGPLAQIKHYAAYNQETNRNTTADNVIVSERALREIYTPAFETAITQANVASVMCAYSVINGQFACENQHTQNEILKGTMAFTGFITADWGAVHSTVASANNGLDMEMPDTDKYFGTALKNAVNAGQVSVATIDDKVRRILTQMFRFGLFDKTQTGTKSSAVTSAAHNDVAKQVAAQGSVLLKNSGPILPLANSGTIAVIGDDAGSGAMFQGGGSAGVNSSYNVTPYNGIKARANGATVNYFSSADQTAAANGARAAGVALVFVNKFQSEGSDTGDIDLGSTQNNLISAVAAANPNTVVVLNTGSAVTMPWVNNVKGIIEAWYPGQENGNAIAAVLFGDINPSGKLPVTFPNSLADVPANTAAQWPGTNGQVQYSEGLNVGYRSYDSRGVAPLFPFGFGLSYTTFSYSALTVAAPDPSGNVAVSFTVTNSGSRAGAEVPQVYVAAPAGSGEPPKSLRGFKKVSLGAGASTAVNITLPLRAFQYWGSTNWTTINGTHTISVGSSSRDIRLTGTVAVTGGTVTNRNAFSTIQAESYDAQLGTQNEPTSDTGGGSDVAFIGNGDWLQYNNVDFGTNMSVTATTLRIASGAGTAAGTVEVHLDSLTGPLVTTVTVNGTGGWQTWQSVSGGGSSAATGVHTLFLKFVSPGAGDFVNVNWLTFTGAVIDPPPPTCSTTNFAQGKPATASSALGGNTAAAAVDGNAGTRWESAQGIDPQWIYVDLGSTQSICKVVLNWEAAAAKNFTIDTATSPSGPWTPIYTTTTGTGGVQTLTVNGSGRYVRMNGTARTTVYGYSLWEFQVFAGTSGGGTPVALARTGWVASASPASAGDVPANALDGNAATRFSSGTPMVNGQTFTVDMGAAKTFDQVTMDSGGSANDYARSYTVQVSNDGATWTAVTTGTGTGAVVTSRFANQSARYVRIVQTAANSSWWSIAEFNVYAG